MITKIFEFIISPMGFILIPLLIIIISCFRKYNNYLDIRQIVIEQWKMLKNNRISFIIMYILPIFIAIGIVRIKSINTEIINNLNVVLSILVAMFFSILSIIINFNNESENYKKTLKETNNTIMFEIILSVFLLIFTFIFMFIENIENKIVLFSISFIIYYLSIIVIINIFMVMKRMSILYKNKSNL